VRRIRALAAAAMLSASVLVGSPSAAQVGSAIELRVMTFNIWYGSTQTHGLDRVIEAIQAAGADVVGLQEPYARVRRIAEALGFHASPRLHVISRYPILEPEGSDGAWGYLLLGPGELAAIANTHLSCCPYTPYRIVNRGMSREDALEQERNTRVGQLQKHLERLQPLLDAGVPTFFTGDFNSPSHRDWTRAAVEARGFPYPIRWPVSLAMEQVGFVDSYRAIHPDPVADPGFTWTPGYPTPYVGSREVFDRIDYVWAAGPATPVDSEIVGESRANADLVIDPWPSDHRAVVSTFDVTPAPAPVFVAAHRERSRTGAPLEVSFHSPGAPGEHVALVDPSTGAVVADAPIGPPPAADGTIALATAGVPQGPYAISLLDAADTELARDTVVLVDAGQQPTLTLADDALEGEQRLEIAWSFAPGNRFDWFGIFRAGLDAKSGSIKAWRYLGGRIDGSTVMGPNNRGAGPWPLPPGDYEVLLCLDDSYRCRVGVPFRVLG
jgi:endonuclease/exonuclease/phosphatase (EEP) superfamily protein YafD